MEAAVRSPGTRICCVESCGGPDMKFRTRAIAAAIGGSLLVIGCALAMPLIARQNPDRAALEMEYEVLKTKMLQLTPAAFGPRRNLQANGNFTSLIETKKTVRKDDLMRYISIRQRTIETRIQKYFRFFMRRVSISDCSLLNSNEIRDIMESASKLGGRDWTALTPEEYDFSCAMAIPQKSKASMLEVGRSSVTELDISKIPWQQEILGELQKIKSELLFWQASSLFQKPNRSESIDVTLIHPIEPSLIANSQSSTFVASLMSMRMQPAKLIFIIFEGSGTDVDYSRNARIFVKSLESFQKWMPPMQTFVCRLSAAESKFWHRDFLTREIQKEIDTTYVAFGPAPAVYHSHYASLAERAMQKYNFDAVTIPFSNDESCPKWKARRCIEEWNAKEENNNADWDEAAPEFSDFGRLKAKQTAAWNSGDSFKKFMGESVEVPEICFTSEENTLVVSASSLEAVMTRLPSGGAASMKTIAEFLLSRGFNVNCMSRFRLVKIIGYPPPSDM